MAILRTGDRHGYRFLTSGALAAANRRFRATGALVTTTAPFVKSRFTPRRMPVQDEEMVRKAATIWLAWTAAALFYISQEFVPRLYRNETVPWAPLFAGWMAAMYICAVFTPAILWLGRRWPVEQGPRWRRAAL